MITGRFDYKDFAEKGWKNFWFKIREEEMDVIEQFLAHTQSSMKDWEDKLAEELSDPLPEEFWHSERPDAITRLFPYMNTGKQANSVHSGLKRKRSGDRLYVSAWAEIDVPYAWFTTRGKKRRKSGVTPGWVGWVSDVFEGSGRGRVMSMSDIFETLMIEREML